MITDPPPLRFGGTQQPLENQPQLPHTGGTQLQPLKGQLTDLKS